MIADQNNNKSNLKNTLLSGFRLAEWVIEPSTNTFKHNGHARHVEPKVMDVLLCLASNAGDVVSREQLLTEVWANLVVTDEVLTRCISELRTALGDVSRERRYIRTLPKRGYALMLPVTALCDEPEAVTDQPYEPAEQPEPLREELAQLQPERKAKTAAAASTDNNAVPASEVHATPWLAREILSLLKSIVQALTRVSVFTLALIFGVFLLIVLGAVLTDRKITVSHDADDGANVVEKIGERLAFAFDEQPEAIASGTAEPSNEPLTVAVLPFINLSGDPDSDYFSNGLAEDIRNTLISTPKLGIRVVARTSSEAFKNKAIDIREIGEQLNTKSLVEGTVRISGERVRVTVQVTNADDGFPVWAESFEYALDDVLRIQTEIAEQVVKQLAPRLAPDTIAVQQDQISVKAYDYYVLGRHHWDQRTAESMQKAADYFREALRVDDNFALAYSGLADALLLSADYGNADRETVTKQATRLAEKALALNPELGEAHASRGLIYRVSGDIEAAKQEYQRAVNFNPNYSMAHMWLGNVLGDLSDVNGAFEHYKVALQLDPLHPAVQQNYISALYSMGRYAEATRLADKYYARSNSERLLKVRLHALLAAGQYDQVLRFAVRHNFSDEYASYATQAVIEALIYLQRYDDADALIEQNRLQFSVNQLAWFRAQQAIAARDADKLLMAAEIMEANKTADTHHKECRSNYISHWRGLAYSMKQEPARANTFFKASLIREDHGCMWDSVQMALLYADYAQSLALAGQDALAADTLAQAWKALNFAVEHGRGGVDVFLSKAGLFIAAGDYAEASENIQLLLDKKWQFYGQLKHLPLFDGLEENLATPDMDLASQYETMQKNSRDLKLTKFGV